MYRVLFNFGILISPEYIIKPANGKRVCEGRLDFKLGESNWAIELVRQENDLQGHVDRFRPGGQYHKEVVDRDGIKDWVIVNLTQTFISEIPEIASMYPSSDICLSHSNNHCFIEDKHRLLHAIFSKDFSVVEFVQGDGKNLGSFHLPY
jgi:hypothetical protein